VEELIRDIDTPARCTLHLSIQVIVLPIHNVSRARSEDGIWCESW
jgi:hypothetical protein